jgi:hypothetical protein
VHVTSEIAGRCRCFRGVALTLHTGADVVANLKFLDAVNLVESQAAVTDELTGASRFMAHRPNPCSR